MAIKILSRFDSSVVVLEDGESKTLLEAVTKAAKSGANLSGADLSGANLSGANLYRADLSGAKNAEKEILKRQIVPQVGAFTVFKKLRGDVICKLLIPEGAKRVGGLVGRKCRAEFAVVLEGPGVSGRDPNFKYEIGKTVKPQEPFDETQEECASGIHFFLSKEEAQEYSV